MLFVPKLSHLYLYFSDVHDDFGNLCFCNVSWFEETICICTSLAS